MDVWRITVASLRRWYILLPLLALTGLAAFAVGDGVRPQYQVTATAMLVPGTTQSEIANPYSISEQTTTALSIVLNNSESRGQIAERGLGSEYETTARPRTTILDFSVLGATPEVGLETGQAVFELAQQELAERQGAAGVPTSAQVSVQILQPPTVSEVVEEGKLRNMAIVGILGAAVSLLVAVLFDDLVGLIRRSARRRRERRAASRETAAVGGAVEADAKPDSGGRTIGERVQTADTGQESVTAAVGEADSESDPGQDRDLARATRDG